MNRLDGVPFGAVWSAIYPKRGLTILLPSTPSILNEVRSRAAAAVPAYHQAMSKPYIRAGLYTFPTSSEKGKAAVLGVLRQAVLADTGFDPYGGSDEKTLNLILALGPDATESERYDLDVLADVGVPPTYRYDSRVGSSYMIPPHPYLDAETVKNRVWTRDREDFGKWRLAVMNAKLAKDTFDTYPWPGPAHEFQSAFREFLGHELADYISSGRAIPPEEFRNWLTISIITKFDEIIDRVEAMVAKRIRQKQRLSIVRGVALSVIGLALGGLPIGAVAAKLAAIGIGALGTLQKRQLEGSLKSIAQEFETEAPAFAAEIDRTVAYIERQIPPEGAYELLINGVKISQAGTLEEISTQASDKTVTGDKIEIFYNGASTGLKVRDAGGVIVVPPEEDARVRAMSADQVKAWLKSRTSTTSPLDASHAAGSMSADIQTVAAQQAAQAATQPDFIDSYELFVEGEKVASNASLDVVTSHAVETREGQRFEIFHVRTYTKTRQYPDRTSMGMKVRTATGFVSIPPELYEQTRTMTPEQIQGMLNKAKETVKAESKGGGFPWGILAIPVAILALK